jgi:hypothetical protein
MPTLLVDDQPTVGQRSPTCQHQHYQDRSTGSGHVIPQSIRLEEDYGGEAANFRLT